MKNTRFWYYSRDPYVTIVIPVKPKQKSFVAHRFSFFLHVFVVHPVTRAVISKVVSLYCTNSNNTWLKVLWQLALHGHVTTNSDQQWGNVPKLTIYIFCGIIQHNFLWVCVHYQHQQQQICSLSLWKINKWYTCIIVNLHNGAECRGITSRATLSNQLNDVVFIFWCNRDKNCWHENKKKQKTHHKIML